MPIVDDIVKGIKKFGDDVIEGAKNGPGKAARIKKGVNIINSNGASESFESYLSKQVPKMEDIVARGRKDIGSLTKTERHIFDEMDKFADSSGKIKNYNEIIAKEMDKIRRMSDKEISDGYDTIAKKIGFNPRPSGVSDADWATDVRDAIDTYIEPGEKNIGRSVGDFAGGGLYGSYNAYKNMAAGKKSIMGALKEGHSVINDAGEKVISGKKVAGTATTVAAASALGNRVFRDEYGELDVPVVPFI